MQGFRAAVCMLRLLVAAALVAAAAGALAQGIAGYPGTVEGFDPREVALLPRWCIYTDTFRDRIPGGQNPQMIAQWHAQMGKIFEAMHHYCYALMKTNRATLLAKDATTRLFYLQDSMREFDYVIDRAPADFILLPEILSKKGENLLRLGKGGTAVLTLERAIELNPGYWPPYAHLSDHYRESGDLKAAREWLDKGLAQAPDTKALRRRIDELERPATARRQP